MTEPRRRPTGIAICTNSRGGASRACADAGSPALADHLEDAIAARGLPLAVRRIVCLGQCDKGPTMRLLPGGDFLFGMTPAALDDLLDRLAEELGGETAARHPEFPGVPGA